MFRHSGGPGGFFIGPRFGSYWPPGRAPMTITPAWTRWLAWWSLAAALVLAGALLATNARAEPAAAEGPSLEQTKTTLDQIEEAAGRDDVTQEALVELRRKLNTATDALRDKIGDL